MESSVPGVAGRTFASSLVGRRREYLSFHATTLGFMVAFIYTIEAPDSFYYWVAVLVALAICMGSTHLVLLFADSRWFRTEVTVEGRHLHFVKGGRNRQMPTAALKDIKIERTSTGMRRTFILLDNRNEAYLILDPADGDELERWATEEASQYGIPVNVREVSFLPFGDFLTPIFCGTAPVLLAKLITSWH